MNTELRRRLKMDFEKDSSMFEKIMENVRNHRNIKILTTEKRRNKLLSNTNYHTPKHFSENEQNQNEQY